MIDKRLSEQVAALEARVRSLTIRGDEWKRTAEDTERELTLANAALDNLARKLTAAESRVEAAKREGAREALTRLEDSYRRDVWIGPVTQNIQQFRDREYPAPSAHAGERETPCHRSGNCHAPSVCATGGPCQYRPAPTPEPEPLVLRVQQRSEALMTEDGIKRVEYRAVEFTPEDCRRIVALGSRPTQTAEG